MKRKRKKSLFILILVFAVLVSGGFFLWQCQQKAVPAGEKSTNMKEKTVTSKKQDEKTKATEKKAASEKNAADTGASVGKKQDSKTDTANADATETIKTAKKIVIDPGHQAKGDSTLEENGPGSGSKKARVTGGTRGTTTGVYEYQLNLTIGELLKSELTKRGYTVYMTREKNDVNISNKERANYASQVGADVVIRLHANGAENSEINGAMVLVPSAQNPYVAFLAGPSKTLGTDILNAYCQETGLKNQGVVTSDTMTGINWSKVPVVILEMGYMTNAADDRYMENPPYQNKMIEGIANGMDLYFQNQN